MDEARSFLALPCPAPMHDRRVDHGPRSSDTMVMARRLFASGQPIRGTLAERYLGARGIDLTDVDVSALRFHPAAHYREAPDSPRQTWPALLAAVTDPAGTIMGVHRTYLDPSLDPARLGKAPVASPRRSLGQLAGAHLRSRDSPVLLVGEGLETVLSRATTTRPAAMLPSDYATGPRPPASPRPCCGRASSTSMPTFAAGALGHWPSGSVRSCP